MSTSYNGWPVLDAAQLVWFTPALKGGTERFAAASPDVAIVAKYLLEQYDQRVEPIIGKTILDDWSWNVRPVRGQTTGYSCHASATAWDVNALAHGRGQHGTLSAAGVIELRKIYAEIHDDAGRDLLRWGGDYVNAPKDEMHHEILPGVSPARVAQAARIIESREQDTMIPKDVWSADLIPVTKAPATKPANPTWSASNALGRLVDNGYTQAQFNEATAAELAELKDLLNEVLGRLPAAP